MMWKIGRVALVLISILFSIVPALAGDCPFCSGEVVAYINVEIYPLERVFGEELTINVTRIFIRNATPLAGEKILLKFYNVSKVIETIELITDDGGLAKFQPKIPGPHTITSIGHSMLINVTTVCGDGGCGYEENYENCPEDCAPCWDGICSPNEASSCWDCVSCGDGLCSVEEDRLNCPEDCASCGDGICDASDGPDCRDCETCGDGYCNLGESEYSCPQDCSPGCGNGICEENERLNKTCLRDCRGCGNGWCERGETRLSCKADCPPECGDGICEENETEVSCPEDCTPVIEEPIVEENVTEEILNLSNETDTTPEIEPAPVEDYEPEQPPMDRDGGDLSVWICILIVGMIASILALWFMLRGRKKTEDTKE